MRSFLAGFLLSLLSVPALPQEDGEHEAARKKLKIAEGLQASLWAANPQVANPVAISIDEKGRIYVAECFRRHTSTLDIHMRKEWLDDDLACRRHEDQVAYHEKRMGERAKEWKVESERIRILEDRSGTGWADRATVFSDGYRNLCEGIGAGVLVRNGEVWYSCIPNLWYLKDTDGDGQADVRKALHHGFGVHLGASGHDFHGLRFGPDGKLYMSHGDRGFHIEADGKVLSFPDGGGVLRCNPDGSDLEIVCVGLRNPQELQFDQYGNLFTGDNNISKAPDVGETCRWTYIVEGADYGWRIGYQFMQTGGAWCAEEQWKLEAGFQVPHVARLGHGPSGVTVHPGVAAIPERYRNHFFMCDYPGGIYTFEMKPKGASFEMVGLEKFLWDLQTPDVEFGPDGAMYVADWVGMWDKVDKGRIWKLADPELLKDSAVLSVKKLGGLRTVLAFERFVALLKDESPRVRFFAAMGLGKIGKRDAIGPILDFLRTNNNEDRMLQHAGIMALTGIEDIESIVKAGKDASPVVRMAALVALRKLKRPELAGFLRDADPKLVLEAARAIYDEPIDAALPELAAIFADQKGKAPERALLRALYANFRLGKVRDVVNGAVDLSYPVPIRLEALRILEEWDHPSGRDRLMGLWRPIPARPREDAALALAWGLPLIFNGPAETALEGARVAGVLQIKEANELARKLFENHERPPVVRGRALRLLAEMNDASVPDLVKQALEEKPEEILREAARVIPKAKLPDGVARLEKLVSADVPISVRQASILSLAELGADGPLEGLLQKAVPAPLQLELIEAAGMRPALKGKAAAFQASLTPYSETLAGGDAAAGRRIFFERSDVQCVRCHQIGDQGGQVGPPLTKIAEQKTREYLLDSIVAPNKQIAEGWGQTALQLQNDAVEVGRVEKETDAALTLVLADGQRKMIPKSDIKARKAALSAMPEDIVKQLSRRDLRDLIEFLAGLK